VVKEKMLRRPLSEERRGVLEEAKEELRQAFGREPD
jgi:hypothetical protein